MLRIVLAVIASILLMQSPAPKPPETPKASPESQAAILKIQLRAAQFNQEFAACQNRDWPGQASKINVEMQAARAAAFKSAKLDEKEWELNNDTFEFTKKPVPTKTEEKK
jgi:hypothetical protein